MPKPPKTQVFYAVVLHDFVAERADELDAKRGDTISVVAQSNREWFVAKPIGRLGRPGLIPVTFVEIRDPSSGGAITDVDALMDRGDLPKVEDWKRAMLTYKQNSIALGVIDSPNRSSVPASSYSEHSPVHSKDPSPSRQQPTTNNDSSARSQTPNYLPDGILLSADVVSFHYEMDEYWFRIDAVFQPYKIPSERQLPPAKQLILFRVYNDFYDFQVSLLDAFPREAGRHPPHPRMLPYMPGPVDAVDDEVTATRRAELDDYLHKLCELNAVGGRYILEHRVVREFLALKPGDVENDTDPRTEEIDRLWRNKQQEYIDPLADEDEYGSEVRDTLGQMRVRDDAKSDGSDYEDEGYAPSPRRQSHDQDYNPYQHANDVGPLPTEVSQASSLLKHAHAQQQHQRTGSASSFRRTPSPYMSSTRSNSPLPDRSGSPQPSRNYSPGPRNKVRSHVDTDSTRLSEYSHTQSQWSDSNHKIPSPASTTSLRSSQAPSLTGRSRSHSSNVNTPPISASIQQTAFVKIKIFDRFTEDLIAIRVHPLVSLGELVEKVQARLGGEVSNLNYRDSLNQLVQLDHDDELRAWMDGTDKHVLFAD